MDSMLDDGGVWWALVVALLGSATLWSLRGLLRGAISHVSVAVFATAVGLWVDDRLPWELVAALVLFGIADRMARLPGRWRRAVVAIVLAAALLLVLGLSGRVPSWVGWSLVPVALVVVPPTATIRRPRPECVVLLALAISMLGVYLCVPDTELMRPALAGFVAAAVVACVAPVRNEVVGTMSAVGLLLWLSATEGYGRGGAVVGAFACVASVLLVTPIATAGRTPRLRALAVPALFVLFCARVAGFRDSRVTTIVLVVAAAGVALLAQRALCRVAASRHRQS